MVIGPCLLIALPVYIYASAYGPEYGLILKMYVCMAASLPVYFLFFFGCLVVVTWGGGGRLDFIYLSKNNLILPLLIHLESTVLCYRENGAEFGCSTVLCFSAGFTMFCMRQMNRMPLCRSHQTLLIELLGKKKFIHTALCVKSGLVNGWCVSIKKMIKVFQSAPGPPLLHVCYAMSVPTVHQSRRW